MGRGDRQGLRPGQRRRPSAHCPSICSGTDRASSLHPPDFQKSPSCAAQTGKALRVARPATHPDAMPGAGRPLLVAHGRALPQACPAGPESPSVGPESASPHRSRSPPAPGHALRSQQGWPLCSARSSVLPGSASPGLQALPHPGSCAWLVHTPRFLPSLLASRAGASDQVPHGALCSLVASGRVSRGSGRPVTAMGHTNTLCPPGPCRGTGVPASKSPGQ